MGGTRPPSRRLALRVVRGEEHVRGVAMSSRGKKKTTMAKLNREARLRDRRNEKQARKEARRDAAAASPLRDPPPVGELDARPRTEGEAR